jgi:hypothetical protein
MESLDLDINNYSIKDLERFFKIKSTAKYTAGDIELKEAQLREQLLNSGHIDKKFKRDLINFLHLAKEWLILVKCPDHKKTPSTIPPNHRLDPSDDIHSNQTISRADDVLRRPETQFIYANPGEFFPGSLNQLNTRTITKCLNIDTRFRNNIHTTNSSDFTLHLPTRFNKVVSMQLSTIELPLSFYGISANYGNNHLWIKVIFYPNETPETITEYEKIIIIPDGNYTACDLIDMVNQMICPKKLDGDLANPTDVLSYVRFTLDMNCNGSGSRLVSFGPSIPSHVDITISEIHLDFTRNIEGGPDTTTNIYTKLGWNLGFTKDCYFGSDFYTGESPIEPSTKYVYLAVDDFNNNSNNHFISAFNQSIFGSDIIARISFRGGSLNTVDNSELILVSEPRIYFGPVDIQRLRVRLFDEHGRVLQMNRSNYSFCLTLKMMYDL